MQFKGARVLNKNANSLSALLLVRPKLGAQDYKDVADYFKNREQATLDTLDQSGGQADEGYSDHLEETRKNYLTAKKLYEAKVHNKEDSISLADLKDPMLTKLVTMPSPGEQPQRSKPGVVNRKPASTSQ